MIMGYRANIVVSRSLDECMKHIQQLNEGNIYWSNRVRFWKVDKTTLDYEIRMWRSMYLLGTVSGELVYQDNQATLVTSKADLSLQLKIGIPIYLLFAILFTSVTYSTGDFHLACSLSCGAFYGG